MARVVPAWAVVGMVLGLFCAQCGAKIVNELVRHRSHPAILAKALHFIHKVQTPVNCSGPYTVVSIGLWGGFAAQFQLAAAEWMRAMAGLNFEVPVLIQGRLMGYSDGLECKHMNNDWTCFFHPVSTCQAQLLASGTKIDVKNYPANDDLAVPPAFTSHGFAFWWGVVQLYLFNVRSFVEDHISRQLSMMNRGRGFILGTPMAGMHVRHGDKHVDGFRDHSLSEEMSVIARSKDCMVRSHCDQCFIFTQVCAELTAERVARNQSSLLVAAEVHGYNASVFSDDPAVHMHTTELLAQLQTVHPRHHHHDNSSIVTPLPVFIASDDQEVLRSAFVLGYLTSLPYRPGSQEALGVSQTTASQGMAKHLQSHPEHGYNATLEIISDIFMLARCSSLIGVCASQVFRMAVAMANASHALKFVAALDTEMIPKVQQLSRKYYVPFPEDFVHSVQALNVHAEQ